MTGVQTCALPISLKNKPSIGIHRRLTVEPIVAAKLDIAIGYGWRSLPIFLPTCKKQALKPSMLLRVSEMVCELPQLRQVDINPIIVDENGVVAVDARVVVWSTQEIPNYLSGPYGHLSILPYPGHYKQTWPLPGGGEYTIRPIRPDDAQMLQQLVQNLTPESRYFRFVSSMAQLPPSMLSRFTLIDYDREMALCAVVEEEGEEGVKERTTAKIGRASCRERV